MALTDANDLPTAGLNSVVGTRRFWIGGGTERPNPLDKPLPLGLVKSIVKLRVKETKQS
jgi:hypothetical protein